MMVKCGETVGAASFRVWLKNFKRINHKEHKEVTKDKKKAIIALRGQEVAKTA